MDANSQTAVMNTNGKPQAQPDAASILRELEEQLTVGYKPTVPILGMFNAQGMPQMLLRQDIELMLTHPDVRQALAYFKGGIAGAEFWGGPNEDAADDTPEADKGLPICPENDQVGRFIKEQCERFWDRGVPGVQSAYEYGWIGGEHVYDEEDGCLKWDSLHHFSPGDTYLLTQDYKPVGIRVKNITDKGEIDLWMAGENVPAKALWYPHQPRYNSFYGQSQLLAAWRPWRRLAWKDGLESVIDGALYRLGYQGPIARYPDEDLQGPSPGAPNTTLDSQGRPRRFARDIMRQIAEQYKAGASIGLPSKTDAHGNYLYDLTLPTSTLMGVGGLIDAAKALSNQITAGIGVPPELLEAASSGSGYSGRRIPLEAFLANQQQIADAILKLFVDQVVRPLVRRNFGDVKFNVQVKSLIKTHTNQAQQQQQGGQGGEADPNRSEAAKRAWEARRSGQSQQQHDNPGQAMFSQQPIITDRLREIARKIAKRAA